MNGVTPECSEYGKNKTLLLRLGEMNMGRMLAAKERHLTKKDTILTKITVGKMMFAAGFKSTAASRRKQAIGFNTRRVF